MSCANYCLQVAVAHHSSSSAGQAPVAKAPIATLSLNAPGTNGNVVDVGASVGKLPLEIGALGKSLVDIVLGHFGLKLLNNGKLIKVSL